MPSKGVQVPDISMTVKAEERSRNRESNKDSLLSAPPAAAAAAAASVLPHHTTPVSYYFDTHSIVLQLQGTGTSPLQLGDREGSLKQQFTTPSKVPEGLECPKLGAETRLSDCLTI
jgi:hypothetical protein